MRNELKPNRAVLVIGVVAIAFSVVLGMASSVDSVTETPTTAFPEGAVVAELGAAPVVLADASEVSSLVESPDPGLVEVGIRVTRGGGLVDVHEGEFTLVTDDGRTFTPTELVVDGDAVVFTINAPVDGHRFQVRWTRANQVRLVLVDQLTRSEVVA